MATNEEVMEEDALENEKGTRVYELGFHLDPELPSEEVKSEYQAIKGRIAEGGTVLFEGDPQSVPLAYTISRQETAGRRDFDTAYFAWIVYEASTEAHAKLLEAVGSNLRVIRFIDLITTKDAARHSSDLRELALKERQDARDAEESTSDTELDVALEGAGV